MRRQVLLALIFVLATLTSGILVYAATAVTTELPAAERQRLAETNQDAVREFYDAVNETLRTGEPNRLVSITPNTILRSAAGGKTWNQAEFRSFLMALRDVHPDFRLTEDELLINGDRVVARVTARATVRGTATALQRIGPPLSWEAVDVFRLSDGRIVDYSNNWPEMEIPQPLWEISVDEMPNPALFAMLRFTYPPDAATPVHSAPGPTLLVVEMGRLAVTVYGTAYLIQAPQDALRPETTLAAGSRTVLNPGDLVVVPAGVSRAIRNDGLTPAVAIEVAAFPYDPLAYVHDLNLPTLSRALAMYTAPGEFTSSVMWPPGVTVQALFAPEVVRLPSRSVMLTVGHMTVVPGESIAPHDAGVGEFVYVESGSLELAPTSEAVRITRAAGVLDASFLESVVPITTQPRPGPWLLAGDALFIVGGTVPAIQSMDGNPLSVVVLRISPSNLAPPAGLVLGRAVCVKSG